MQASSYTYSDKRTILAACFGHFMVSLRTYTLSTVAHLDDALVVTVNLRVNRSCRPVLRPLGASQSH